MAKVPCCCLKPWLRPFAQVEAEFSPWELGLSEEAVHKLILIVGIEREREREREREERESARQGSTAQPIFIHNIYIDVYIMYMFMYVYM